MDDTMKIGVKKSKIEKIFVPNPYASGGTKTCVRSTCNLPIPANAAGCPYCGAIQREF